ncbi:MAG: CBS domain-containing protein [Candidatus Bathyarchaeia archaeon]|nr:CBS domain-containing protein [Candidatus Bathyarchaeota archaeon]
MPLTGSILKKKRLEAGLTQSQLAKMVGVSQAHIAKIESEKVDPRLSTVNKILEILEGGKGRKCAEIMTRNVITATPKDKIREASEIMVRHAISQLPIIDDGKVVGMITEESIIRNLNPNIAEETLEKIMKPPFPSVPEDTDIAVIRPLLEKNSGVLVTKKGKLVGIITRSDLLKVVSNIAFDTMS